MAGDDAACALEFHSGEDARFDGCRGGRSPAVGFGRGDQGGLFLFFGAQIDTLGKLTPEVQAVVDNSINHWISMGMGEWSEWCFPWAAIIQARMGSSRLPGKTPMKLRSPRWKKARLMISPSGIRKRTRM